MAKKIIISIFMFMIFIGLVSASNNVGINCPEIGYVEKDISIEVISMEPFCEVDGACFNGIEKIEIESKLAALPSKAITVNHGYDRYIFQVDNRNAGIYPIKISLSDSSEIVYEKECELEISSENSEYSNEYMGDVKFSETVNSDSADELEEPVAPVPADSASPQTDDISPYDISSTGPSADSPGEVYVRPTDTTVETKAPSGSGGSSGGIIKSIFGGEDEESVENGLVEDSGFMDKEGMIELVNSRKLPVSAIVIIGLGLGAFLFVKKRK